MEGTPERDSQLEVGIQLVAGEEGTAAGQGMSLEVAFGVGRRAVAVDNHRVHREVEYPVACGWDPWRDRLLEWQPGLSR